jgi:hypothetical protein
MAIHRGTTVNDLFRDRIAAIASGEVAPYGTEKQKPLPNAGCAGSQFGPSKPSSKKREETS